MRIQQNGGFKSYGDGPKEKNPPQPLQFKVKFTWWPIKNGDCSPEDESMIVLAMSYDEAVINAEKHLKAAKLWKQVIAIYAVEFLCNKWGVASLPSNRFNTLIL